MKENVRCPVTKERKSRYTDSNMEGTKYFMRELDLDVFKINICQELESDVGGVVWDSALVASYYIARRSHAWKEKKVWNDFSKRFWNYLVNK